MRDALSGRRHKPLLTGLLLWSCLLEACASQRERAGGATDEDEGPEVVQPSMDAAIEREPDGAPSDAELDARGEFDALAPIDADDAQVAVTRDAAADAAPPVPTCRPFDMPTDCSAPSDGVLPRDLRCTGLYGDFAARSPACGVLAYTPAYQLWSDGAHKQRYVSLPVGAKVDVTDPDHFVFPVGTRFWKEFSTPAGRLLETRLLQKSELGWLYTTYVWSEDGAAALQQNQGVEDLHASGHRVPTRDQCAECHAGSKDFVLGWDALLLGSGALGLTQRGLAERGWLINTESAGGAPTPAQLALRIPGNELEQAALGYLHVNCGVSCHNESPDARARDTGFWMRLESDALARVADTDTVKTGVNKLPSPHASQPGGKSYLGIRPGDPEHSLLIARMDTRGEGSMPPIASSRVDEAGVRTVSEWIAAMAGNADYPPADPLPALPDAGSEDAGGADAGDALPDAGAPPEAGAGDDAGGDSCGPLSAPSLPALAVATVVRDTRLATLTFAAQPPGDDDWYLVEMRGRILRVHDGALEDTPFLDLSSAISLGEGFDQTTAGYDERGLVGLAFAPDYPATGLFYVTITPSRANALGLPVNNDMVLEYQRQTSGPPLHTRTLLQVGSANQFLGNIHNANTVLFGPDGMLYVGMGDGGGVSCNNAELNAAQNVGSVFGKLLRLDPSRPAPHAALGNPFANVAGGDPRVLHYGLRNPFRFAFDRGTGDLYLGDVGQNRFEELDFAPAGAQGLNFGWATYEALSECMSPARPLRPGTTPTSPLLVVTRGGSGGPLSDYRAIVGGRVYRGDALPELEGVYLFGDYYGRRLGALRSCGGQASALAILRKSCDPNFPEPCLARPAGAPAISELTAIVEDHDGELYLVANGDSLLRIVRAP